MSVPDNKWSCDHCGRIEDDEPGWVFSPEHGDYAACPACVKKFRVNEPSKSVTINRARLERLLRVVLLAKEADRLERRALLLPVGLAENDAKRLIAMSQAFGARIDMGGALDALEEGDTTL